MYSIRPMVSPAGILVPSEKELWPLPCWWCWKGVEHDQANFQGGWLRLLIRCFLALQLLFCLMLDTHFSAKFRQVTHLSPLWGTDSVPGASAEDLPAMQMVLSIRNISTALYFCFRYPSMEIIAVFHLLSNWSFERRNNMPENMPNPCHAYNDNAIEAIIGVHIKAENEKYFILIWPHLPVWQPSIWQKHQTAASAFDPHSYI